MKYYYDLHIHSALSLCADNDMTPQNIAAMAKLAQLDIIAVSDHNSAGNALSVSKASAAMNGPLVVPAVELTTSEDIHILLLFRNIDGAQSAWNEIREKQSLKIPNKPEKYGYQYFMDENDCITGEEPTVLSFAIDISADDAAAFARKHGGIAIPAHADKPANSIISVLGDVPDEAGFTAVELTQNAPPSLRESLIKRGYHILSNSDSHFLGIMNERSSLNAIDLPELSTNALIDKLSKMENG
ncbi:MAG: PHP domain-containing protein [Firmicutes bacterium]|nr:PHP domain-containing protein [Bacillota bacterium]